MQGKYHAETNAALVNAKPKETVHPDDHLNHSFALLGGTVLTQLSLKAGLNKWKEYGEQAVSKELTQLHHRESFKPVHPKDLTPQHRKQVLESMNLDFSVPGEVKITMIPYVKGMLADFSKYDSSDKTAPTPAGVNLFKVDPNCALISEAMATAYHNMTAKALFLTKRARPDISTAVAFLTTRVKKPDVHDWMKCEADEIPQGYSRTATCA